jgi:hypothetical protein
MKGVKSAKRAVSKRIYEPPRHETIYEYNRAVCKELGELLGAEFDSQETRSELANLLRVIAEIETNQLNKRLSSLDSGESQE